MELEQVLTALRNADAAGNVEDARQLARIAQQLMAAQPPEEAAAPKPKTGIGAAVGKGVESIISSGRTAYGALTGDAEEAARAGLERGEALNKKYADQVSLQKVKDAYNKDGVLSAAGEALSQIPAAIAEQAPNLAAMAGSARLGATAGSVLGPVGATVGGIGGALLPSLIQQLGGNIERRKSEGLPANVGLSAAAAIPQAGLDVAGSLIPFGGRIVQKLTGIPMGALLSRSAEGAAKLADERLLTVLAKGVGVGALAEIPTEVAQQMLERAQAGLSLSSPDALKEYGETAYQVGLLAPLGAVGRLSERGGARMDVAAKQQEAAAQAAEVQQSQQAALAQTAEDNRQSLPYALQVQQDYTAAVGKLRELQQAAQTPVGDDPLAAQDAKDAKAALKTHTDTVLQPLVKEAQRVRALYPDLFPTATPTAPAAIAAVPAIPTAVAPDVVESAVAPPLTTVTPIPEATAPLTKTQAAEGTVSAPVDEVASTIAKLNAQSTSPVPPVPAVAPGIAETGVAPVKKPRAKKAVAEAPVAKAEAPVVPVVEDTTVEPTEPKTLEQSFAAMQPIAAKPSPLTISALKTEIGKARKEGRRDDARELIAELRVRTDKSQFMIPGAAPLKRTRAVQTQELTQEIRTELTQLSKAYIAARQEGRRPDALAIIDRMRYLKEQGKAVEVGPVLKGAANTGQSETIETKPADRTSPRALQQDIARAQALPNLSDTNAELLDKLQQNLPALLRYKAPTTGQTPGLETTIAVPEAARGAGNTRVRIVDFLDSLRQGLPAETEARNLQQQLTQIERQAQQEVSPRELQGMLAKAAKLELSNKEKGLVRLVGENQSTIMEDPAARIAVARWLSSDVGQGIGDATQDLRKYFGVVEEEQNYESPVGKATSARAKDIASEYARAVSALDGAYADASVPLQPLANNIARMKGQLSKANERVETATAAVAQAKGAAKRTEQTKLTTAQDAYASLEKQISAAEAKYRTDLTALQTAPGTAEKIATAKADLREAAKLKGLQDTLLDSERTRDRGEVQKALDKARPLNVQAETKTEAPTEAKTSEMQEDMFPAERKQETERENTRAMYEDLFSEQKPTVAETRAEKQKESSKERKLTGDLSALPGKQISFERRRAMLDAIDDAPVKRQAFEDAINNANLPQEQRDAAQTQLTAYLAKLRKKAADKDKSYATAYRLRGEESQKTQDLKKQAEAPGLTDAKRKGLQARFKKAQDQLNKRDEQLARLRGVAIDTIETPEQRSQTLDTLFRETYGQAVSEEQQIELDKTEGRALGPVTRKEVFPAKVFYSGEEGSVKETEKRTYTRPDMRLGEKRGVKQRDVQISKAEMESSNKLQQQKKEAFDARAQEQQLFEIAQKKVEDLSAKLTNIKERVAAVGRLDPRTRKQTLVDSLNVEQTRITAELSAAKTDAAQAAPKTGTISQKSEGEIYGGEFEGKMRGTSGPNDTPLSAKNVDLLGGNKLAAVLTNISEKSSNHVARRIAGKLAAVVEVNGVNVKLVEVTTRDAPNAPGMTTADGMRVVINENTGLSEETVVHEAAHAATMFELEKPDSELTPDQRKAKAELTRMMERVKSDENFDNVVIKDGDLHEFIAEGLGSRAVQAHMREDTWDGRSMWRWFIDAVLRFVGVRTPARGPMLDRFLDLAETFIQARDADSVAQTNLMAASDSGRLRNFGDEVGLYSRAGKAFDLNGFYTYPIGSFGPVENAAFVVKNYALDGLTLDILDMDLVKAGNKPSRSVVERFWLSPNKPGDWTTAEVHTDGVPTNASAVISKYKKALRSVDVPGFDRDPYIKFDEGSFSNTDIRAAFRTLRTEALGMGLLKDIKALTIKRATGANPNTAPRTVLNPAQIARFRSVGSLLSPKDVKYANPGLAAAGVIGDTFIAKERGVIDRVRAASGGWLGSETMLVDRFAPLERLSKGMEALKGSQMMYYLRMYDQRMNFTAQSVANGAIQRVAKKRPDGRTEYVVESVDGANIQQVVDILKKAPAGSPDAANRLFTMYLAGIRAKNKGFQTLHFGKELTEAQLDSAMVSIRATPGLEENFKQARDVYNEYNRNMVGFLEQSGAISKAHAARLTKENDYVPFYREQNGVALLTIGGETPIRIGSIAEQPYLHELVGGDRPILDFLTSSVQNTALITDMGLRNLATKNSMNELEDIKLAQIRPGPGTADTKTVRFKVDGDDYHAIVDTDEAGVPADLLVKGMQGIPTQLPALVRALGVPATWLRRAVTLSPTYAARQIFRDSLAAPLLSGADFVPVLGALKELGKSATKSTLEKRGVTGGQVFAGGSSSEAMTKILNDMLTGKGNIGALIAKAEALNMEADAATRRAQYNSYIKQGLSEMEATLMALESMNFNKRGASPSAHMANSLIPFFNSQIQGLNVLYKALTGKLPFDKRLKIQEKLITRGALMFGASLAYAAMMQDDEAYKNATPEQKYGNWFIRIPGIDEPIKFPVPFEVGYLFKALPEALYNSMANENGSEEAFKAFRTIILQTIPGGSSYFIPQAIKPAIEYGMGKSFYTGRDILSRREQAVLPEQQFRESSSEISKMLGSGLGLSPIKIEALVSGYTGTMGLALMQVLSMGVPTGESPEKTTKRLSDMPVIGSSFQPNDAGGIINAVYERMNDVKKVKTTVDRMLSEGRVAEAKELVSQRSEEFAQSGVADYFTSNMQQITKYENAIRASNLTGDEKQAKLAEMRQLKIRLAETVRQATDAAKKVD